MQVWRICKKRYSDAALTGEGARLYSGRWNPAGVRMVYTSSSLALAALEFFVHLDPSVAPDDLVSVSATIPSTLKTERIALKELPADWRAAENTELQSIGSTWALNKRSVALEVPSVVIEGDWNVLLNPAHPEFSKIQIAKPKPFHFDKRMFRTR
jgi:RES domain-containing protein